MYCCNTSFSCFGQERAIASPEDSQSIAKREFVKFDPEGIMLQQHYIVLMFVKLFACIQRVE